MPTISEQLSCVEREIRMREKLYPRWVGDRKMTRDVADREISAMKAVAQTLRTLEMDDLLP